MYRKNPFGNPDGAQASIEDLRKDFIDVVPPSAAVGGTGEDFTTMRFIVGSKGSGKTHYLHMLQYRIKERNQDNEYSIYSSDIENICADTDQIVRFCHFYNSHFLVEKWERVWLYAIYSAVISHVINDDFLCGKIDDDTKDFFSTTMKKIGLTIDCKMGIYNYLRQILYLNDTKNKVDAFINNHEWDVLTSRIKNSVLRNLPPMYFYLDSIDEDFEHAPSYWTKCQKGAYAAVSSLLKEPIIREKVHVILSIRDSIFASIRRSENQTKITYETHVLRLHWNYNSLAYFIRQKIRRLNSCYFLKDVNQGKNINSWLGMNNILNVERDCEEDIIEYILRHTRLIPRDVVNICNSLSRLKMMTIENPEMDISEEIRRRVSNCAKEIGDELINICAKQLVSDEIHVDVAKSKYEDTYTSVDEYTHSRFLIIKEILSNFNKDTFSNNELDMISEQLNNRLGHDCHIINILWMNGVIGYFEKEKVTFYLRHNSISTDIPRKHSLYALRSCMIDSLEIENYYPNPIL